MTTASPRWNNYTERSDVAQIVVYIGGYFEKNTTTNVATSCYAFNGQNVAMRQGSTVSFLHSDQAAERHVLLINKFLSLPSCVLQPTQP